MHEIGSTPAPIEPSKGAGRGMQWWSSAFSWLFGDVSRLGIWVGMWICFFVILALLHLVPFLGSIASYLLYFIFTGGLMIAARRSARGEAPPFGDLFSGFGAAAGPLMGVGVIVFVANLIVFGLMLAIGVGAVITAFVSSAVGTGSFPGTAALGMGMGTALLLLACLALLIPISMAAWLAPALVVLRGTAPVEALRLSLAACRRNLGALTVYGLVFIGLAIVATLFLGLGWFFLMPLVFLSTYAAYEDLFGGAAEVLG